MRNFLSLFILFLLVSCMATEEGTIVSGSQEEESPQAEICELEGSWRLTVEKVVTNNPPGPCGLQDCGYGAEPNCGLQSMVTATTNQLNEVDFEMPMAGLVGDDWSGTFNGALQFESTHEFYDPDSTFEGSIDTNDCTMQATIIWNPGTCDAEITLTAERM